MNGYGRTTGAAVPHSSAKIRRDSVLVSSSPGPGTLQLSFNDPGRRNAMGEGMRDEVIEALERANEDPSIRVIVFSGEGGTFCSGGDLSNMPPGSLDEARQRLAKVSELVRLLAESPKITIASVEGAAAGLGASLAIACDYVFMAENGRFLFPFTRLGLIPDGGIMHTLGVRVGISNARRILLDGQSLLADECLAAGIADHVVPAGLLEETVLAKAAQLAALAPLAVSGVKTIFSGETASLASALAKECEIQPGLFFTRDFAEGKAAYMQKRPPVFAGY